MNTELMIFTNISNYHMRQIPLISYLSIWYGHVNAVFSLMSQFNQRGKERLILCILADSKIPKVENSMSGLISTLLICYGSDYYNCFGVNRLSLKKNILLFYEFCHVLLLIHLQI